MFGGTGAQPLRDRHDVGLGDRHTVLEAQQVFEHHLHRMREFGNPRQPVFLGQRQRVIGVGLVPDRQSGLGLEAIQGLGHGSALRSRMGSRSGPGAGQSAGGHACSLEAFQTLSGVIVKQDDACQPRRWLNRHGSHERAKPLADRRKSRPQPGRAAAVRRRRLCARARPSCCCCAAPTAPANRACCWRCMACFGPSGKIDWHAEEPPTALPRPPTGVKSRLTSSPKISVLAQRQRPRPALPEAALRPVGLGGLGAIDAGHFGAASRGAWHWPGCWSAERRSGCSTSPPPALDDAGRALVGG